MDELDTAEFSVRKACLVKVGENGDVCRERVQGVEWSPPAPGASYVLYLGRGKFLKTTPIKELKQIHNALMFRTANSVYRVEYAK